MWLNYNNSAKKIGSKSFHKNTSLTTATLDYSYLVLEEITFSHRAKLVWIAFFTLLFYLRRLSLILKFDDLKRDKKPVRQEILFHSSIPPKMLLRTPLEKGKSSCSYSSVTL